MRKPTDQERLAEFLREVGRVVREPTDLYLVGGSSAVLLGWRATTADIDVRVEPDDEFLRAVVGLKERLQVNVELASPMDFLPELPGWRDRSPFVAQEGAVTVRHFDFSSQALAKLERGFAQDLDDVRAMLAAGLIEPAALSELLGRVKEQLYRYPAVDPGSLELAVNALADQQLAEGQ